MKRIFNPKWNAGWLQWAYELNAITKEAEAELEQLKNDHLDWNFKQLAEDVRNQKIKAWL